jgi:CheY-like chemotaxis protein
MTPPDARATPVPVLLDAVRILLVDDDEVDREMVRRLLGKAGISAQVTEAVDPLAALALLKKHTYDLMILDHHFPRHDGLLVLRELKERGDPLPVIALTGLDESALAVELMKNGAADYLPKGGLTPQRLAQAIRQAQRIGTVQLAARAVQEALRASEELNRRLMDLTDDCIELIDLEGRMLSMNGAGQRALGITDFSVWWVRPWIDRWDPACHRDVAHALDEARLGRTAVFTATNGPSRWRAQVAPLLSAEGRPDRLLAVSRRA